MEVQLIDGRRRSAYTDRRLGAFVARCRAHGLAVTPQRLAIIHALLSSAEHPSADTVYATVRRDHPYVSLATVHRTLEVLCTIGEARKVTILHDSARYDGNVTPHHHVVCVACRRIHDVEVADAERLLQVGTPLGDYHILGASVEIQAVCGACRRAQSRHR